MKTYSPKALKHRNHAVKILGYIVEGQHSKYYKNYGLCWNANLYDIRVGSLFSQWEREKGIRSDNDGTLSPIPMIRGNYTYTGPLGDMRRELAIYVLKHIDTLDWENKALVSK